MKHAIFSFLLLCLILASCTGEEVGRIPVNAVSRDSALVKESSPLHLDAGDKLYFWADMDIEYEGSIDLQYVVEMWCDGKKEGGFNLDPLDVNLTIGGREVTAGNRTEKSYQGRIDFVKITKGGDYVFKTILKASDNPTLKINKADLVMRK